MTGCLTAADLDVIGRARELAYANHLDDYRRALGQPDLGRQETSPHAKQSAVYASSLGLAQYLLAELVDLAEQLGGEQDQTAEDARRLGEIRSLLARFDWEHDDRQLALEAIERIVEGGAS